MSVAFVSKTEDPSSSGRNSFSFSHNVASGSDRIVVIFVILEADASISGTPTYDGSNMTLALRYNSESTSFTELMIEVWYRVLGNGDAINGTVAGSIDQTTDPSVVIAADYTGVDQSDPVGATAGDQELNTDNAIADVEITTDAENSLIVGAAGGQGGDYDPWVSTDLDVNIVERVDADTGTSTVSDMGYWMGDLPAASVDTYTFGSIGSTNDENVVGCIELHAVASSSSSSSQSSSSSSLSSSSSSSSNSSSSSSSSLSSSSSSSNSSSSSSSSSVSSSSSSSSSLSSSSSSSNSSSSSSSSLSSSSSSSLSSSSSSSMSSSSSSSSSSLSSSSSSSQSSSSSSSLSSSSSSSQSSSSSSRSSSSSSSSSNNSSSSSSSSQSSSSSSNSSSSSSSSSSLSSSSSSLSLSSSSSSSSQSISSSSSSSKSYLPDINVDTEIALLIDISSSMDAAEYALCIDGYAAAFRDAVIQSGVVNGVYGQVAVCVVLFFYDNTNSAEAVTLEIDWTLLDSGAAMDSFATAIEAIVRPDPPVQKLTNPGSAVSFTYPLFVTNGYVGTKKIIDISGDGVENRGDDTDTATDAAITSGIDQVNGIVVTSSSVVLTFYEDNVIKGTGSFVIQGDSYDDFETLVTSKLGQELSSSSSSSQSQEQTEWTTRDSSSSSSSNSSSSSSSSSLSVSSSSSSSSSLQTT